MLHHIVLVHVRGVCALKSSSCSCVDVLLRSLKSRLAMQYPKAYSVAEAKYRLQIEDESTEVE